MPVKAEHIVVVRSRRLVSHAWFETAVFITIVMSCLLLIYTDSTKEDYDQVAWIRTGYWTVSGLFFMEMVLKLLAWGPERYFRDKWNWIDFVVVLEAVVAFILNILHVLLPRLHISGSAIRVLSTLRALRPLRTAQFLPPVRLIIRTFLASLAETGSLLIVIFIFMFVFAVAGQVFFHHSLSSRCYNDVTGALFAENVLCGHEAQAYHCPSNYTCRDSGYNPEFGTVSFKDLFSSFITVFQIATQQGWMRVTWYLQDGRSRFAWVFTVVLIFFVQAILVNLFPAILTTKFYRTLTTYNAALDHRKREQEARKRRMMLKSTKVEDAEKLKSKELEAADDGGDSDDLDYEDDTSKRKDFKRILQRFDDAEKEDMKMVESSMEVRGSDIRDPLLMGRTKLPLLAPPGKLCGELRRMISTEGSTFLNIIYLCTLLNCLMLAIESYPFDPRRTAIVYHANVAFTSIFLFEMLVKLLAFGPVGYVMDAWNIFDGVVTILTTVSLTVRSMKLVGLLRVVRMAKLVTLSRASSTKRAFTVDTVLDPIMDLPRIMSVLSSTMSFAGYLFVLLFVFTFIFAVAGKQYLGAVVGIHRFKTFGQSMVSVFQMISGDGWNTFMWEAVGKGGGMYAVYFIMWLVISKWFILSFVTAMVVYYVDLDGRDYLAFVARGTTVAVCKMERAMTKTFLRTQFRRFKDSVTNTRSARGKVELIEETVVGKDPNACVRFWKSESSFGVFFPGNPFRKLCQTIVDSTLFGNIVLLMIVIGAVTMSIDLDWTARGLTQPPLMQTAFTYIEYLVTLVFILELALYSIGSGFIATREAYLRGGLSNCVDFFITFTSVINILLDLVNMGSVVNLSVVKVIRVLRVFRILRIVTRSKITRLILSSLITSGKGVGYVILIISVIVVIFAIVGQQLFAGKFYYCGDPAFPVGGYRDVNYQGFPHGCTHDWRNTAFNYDKFNRALLSSIVTFSLDGWEDLLKSSMDAYGVDRNSDVTGHAMHNTWSALYYVVYVGITYIVTPLFVGVLYGTFLYSIYVDGNLKKRVASIKDAEWAIYRMKLSFIKPLKLPSRPPRLRGQVYDMIHGVRYKVFIFLVVSIHMILRFGTNFENVESFFTNQQPLHTVFHDPGNAFNLLATLIYCVDLFAVRTFALGIRGIIHGPLEKLDVMVTLLYVAEYVIHAIGAYGQFSEVVFHVMSALLALRLLRILNALPGACLIISVVGKTIKGVLSILVLFIGILYIYAIFGLIFFSKHHVFPPSDPLGHRHASFNSLSSAMLMLVGVATCDDWVNAMAGLASGMSPSVQWVVYAYFCSFLIINQFVIWNMYLLITLQKFEIHNEDKTGLAMGQVREFRRAWQIFDERGTGRITLKRLSLLLRRLGEPLGTSKRLPLADAARTAKKLYYLIQLSGIKRIAEEVENDPAASRKDRLKRVVYWVVKKDDAMLHTAEGGHGRYRTLEDLAWHQTCDDPLAPESRNIRVTFKNIIIAAHQNAIFKTVLPDEDEVRARRQRAQDYVTLLREGVWGLVNKSRLSLTTREAIALSNMHTLRRYSSSAFLQRLPVVVTYAFEAWKVRVETVGYNDLMHEEGTLLMRALGSEGALVRGQYRLFEQACKESVEDAEVHKARLDELRKCNDILERHLRLTIETRQRYVDVIWELASVETVQQFRIPHSSINAVAMAADAELLYLGASDGTVKVFRKKDMSDGTEALSPVPTGDGPIVCKPNFKFAFVQEFLQESAVLSIVATADGKKVFTAGKDNFIRCWTREVAVQEGKKSKGKGPTGAGGGKPSSLSSPSTPLLEYRLSELMTGHKGEVYAMDLYTANILFSAGQDGYLRMWRVPGNSTIQNGAVPNTRSMLGGRPTLFCTTVFEDTEEPGDKKYVAAGGSDGMLSIFTFRTDPAWATMTENWRPMLTVDAASGRAVTSVRIAWKRLYTAASDGAVCVWEIKWEMDASGTRTGIISGLQELIYSPMHAAPVSSLVFVGGLLFSSSHDMSVVPWTEPVKEVDPKDATKSVLRQGHKDEYGGGDGDDGAATIGVGSVLHRGAITSMAGSSAMLISADVHGNIVVRAPCRKRERVKKGGVRTEPGADEPKKRRRRRSTASDIMAATGQMRRTVSALRALVARSPALEGLVMTEPDFLDENVMLRLTPQTYLAMYLSHVFPPRVIGEKRKGALLSPMGGASPPLSPNVGPIASSYGENFMFTPRDAGADGANTPAGSPSPSAPLSPSPARSPTSPLSSQSSLQSIRLSPQPTTSPLLLQSIAEEGDTSPRAPPLQHDPSATASASTAAKSPTALSAAAEELESDVEEEVDADDGGSSDERPPEQTTTTMEAPREERKSPMQMIFGLFGAG